MTQFAIISGGQTGIDLAALEAAEACSVPYSGWVPKDFTNELGAQCIPVCFRACLREASTAESAERTELNIKDADGVLTLLRGEGGTSSARSPGTQHGIDHAKSLGKTDEQMCFVDLAGMGNREEQDREVERVVQWVRVQKVIKCAIGGPRESEEPGIQNEARAFLLRLFEALQADDDKKGI